MHTHKNDSVQAKNISERLFYNLVELIFSELLLEIQDTCRTLAERFEMSHDFLPYGIIFFV